MPHRTIRPINRRHARAMRHAPTDAEDRLWQTLRDRRLDGLKFRRQLPVGRFIVDFACLQAGLAVELDGSHHAGSRRDEVRDAALAAAGFRVLRFWNDDVLRDLDAVCDTIIAYARDATLIPWRHGDLPSPPEGEGGAEGDG